MTKIRRLTTLALLSAAALVVFVIEAQIPPLTPIPGIKLGIANAVSLFALYAIGPAGALSVLLIRIFLGNLVTGQIMAIAYSLTGGLFSFGLATLLRCQIPEHQLWVVSVFSAMAHNLGQILAAVIITATPSLWWYLPILLVGGIITGAFTGLAAQLVLLRLRRAVPSFFR